MTVCSCTASCPGVAGIPRTPLAPPAAGVAGAGGTYPTPPGVSRPEKKSPNIPPRTYPGVGVTAGTGQIIKMRGGPRWCTCGCQHTQEKSNVLRAAMTNKVGREQDRAGKQSWPRTSTQCNYASETTRVANLLDALNVDGERRQRFVDLNHHRWTIVNRSQLSYGRTEVWRCPRDHTRRNPALHLRHRQHLWWGGHRGTSHVTTATTTVRTSFHHHAGS